MGGILTIRKRVYNDSGMSSVIGIILITAIMVVSSVAVYVVVSTHTLEDPVIANINIESYNSTSQEVVLVHNGGDSFDVSQISIIISVNGETLDKNLIDLPVISAPGFDGFLGGVLWGTPTNQSHDNVWDSGDRGDFKIAISNKQIYSGDQLKVIIFHRPTGTIISSPSRGI
jgi:FlaG/FlaF family flagellin (archaellin)